VQLTFTLPDPKARLWIENQEMPETGAERVFLSPPLGQGKPFVYTIRIAWTENGREVSQEKTLDVTAGQNLIADFSNPPNAVVSVDDLMLAYEHLGIQTLTRN
jgi:uncharacterized protein (TIGR03000 family)